ncbi:MAG: glutathionylspermidine synthase [Hyphomicrobiales bacterium]|nr:glutathionylspermidine synthase [Hyphomicrobiales bacterium]
MQRRAITQRPDWQSRADALGFDFHTNDGLPYWDETACYTFSLAQVEDDIEHATQELGALCLDVVGRIIGDEQTYERLAIPAHARDMIAASFRRGDPSLYGRFDFAYDGKSAPKLLEYNADTPTALFEAAVFQWYWLEEQQDAGHLPRHADQFNSIHERLIERWREIGRGRIHFASMDTREDVLTTDYLADCARQAGHDVCLMDVADIGLRGNVVCDRSFTTIERLFKLYPWEWMFVEDFGRAPQLANLRALEPAWKALLSCKGILALLWEFAPGHPNLLPAFFERDDRKLDAGPRFARKPLWSREGANILLIDGENVLAQTGGTYGAEGYMRQKLVDLPDFDGNFPVIGSWLVGEKSCGMGIREDRSRITGNGSRFIPHAIL